MLYTKTVNIHMTNTVNKQWPVMLIINRNSHRLTDTTKGEILFVCLAVFPHHIYSELTCKTILFPKPSLYICQFTKRYMVHVQLLCRLLTEVHRSCGLGISKLHDINLRIRIWEYWTEHVHTTGSILL